MGEAKANRSGGLSQDFNVKSLEYSGSIRSSSIYVQESEINFSKSSLPSYYKLIEVPFLNGRSAMHVRITASGGDAIPSVFEFSVFKGWSDSSSVEIIRSSKSMILNSIRLRVVDGRLLVECYFRQTKGCEFKVRLEEYMRASLPILQSGDMGNPVNDSTNVVLETPVGVRQGLFSSVGKAPYYIDSDYKFSLDGEDINEIFEPKITKKSAFNLDKSDSVNSASSTTLATSKAVKTSYDKAIDAYDKAVEAIRKPVPVYSNANEAYDGLMSSDDFTKLRDLPTYLYDGFNLPKSDSYIENNSDRLATSTAVNGLRNSMISAYNRIYNDANLTSIEYRYVGKQDYFTKSYGKIADMYAYDKVACYFETEDQSDEIAALKIGFAKIQIKS